MRRTFAKELHKQMHKNKDIVLLTGDLGFGVLDKIKEDFESSGQFINIGISEQLMVGAAAGMAAQGKTVFCYSITPFLIYRALEFIRNDVDYDRANVKIIGTGRDREYNLQGFTHWCDDEKMIVRNIFKNTKYFRPEDKKEVSKIVRAMIKTDAPCYLSLSRY